SSSIKPFKKADLTSIWKTLKLLEAANARKIRIASKRATGAKVSSKSIPSFLAKPLGNKTSLVPNNQTILTLLVFENPLRSDGITSRWRLDQNPNLVSFKIFKFLMHGIDPIRIRKSVSNIFGLKRGNKR